MASKAYVGAYWQGSPAQLADRSIIQPGDLVPADVIGEDEAKASDNWKPAYESAKAGN